MFILSRDPISVQCPDTLYKYIYIYQSFSGRHKDVDGRTKRIRWKRFVYDFLVFTQFLVYKTLHHSDIYMCRRLCSWTSSTHTCSIAIRRIKCFGVYFSMKLKPNARQGIYIYFGRFAQRLARKSRRTWDDGKCHTESRVSTGWTSWMAVEGCGPSLNYYYSACIERATPSSWYNQCKRTSSYSIHKASKCRFTLNLKSTNQVRIVSNYYKPWIFGITDISSLRNWLFSRNMDFK